MKEGIDRDERKEGGGRKEGPTHISKAISSQRNLSSCLGPSRLLLLVCLLSWGRPSTLVSKLVQTLCMLLFASFPSCPLLQGNKLVYLAPAVRRLVNVIQRILNCYPANN